MFAHKVNNSDIHRCDGFSSLDFLLIKIMRQYSNFVEANWMSTYKSSDQLWLTDSLNWEKTASIATSDFSFVSFLYNSAFINQHLLTDSITKISQLDVILLASNVYSFSFKTLFMHFIVDLNTELFNLYLCYVHLSYYG